MDQNKMQAIKSVIEQILGMGIAISGQISINNLTLTSTDKAKELGILPQKSQQQGQQSQSGQFSNQGDGKGQSDQPISREEFQSLQDQLQNLEQQLQPLMQQDSGQRGRGTQR